MARCGEAGREDVMRYEFRDDGGLSGRINRPADGVNAQVVGEAIDLVREHFGRITPQAVIEYAEPEESPIHEYFEWDNGAAAQKWREEQARSLISAVYVVHEREGNTDDLVTRAFVAVDSQSDEARYEPIATVLNDPQLYHKACERAKNEMGGFILRFATFKALRIIGTKAHEQIEEELRRTADATETVGA
jgi:hypothetical protein